MNKRTIAGHLMSVLTILIWGTTYVSTKVLLKDLQPIEILFYRFLLGYIALICAYPRFQRSGSWKEEWLFCGAGVSGITLYFLVENIALKYTYASNAGLLIAIAPIVTAVLAHLFSHDEKFGANLAAGFIIAMIGIFLVLFNGRFILNINPLGDLLALLAAFVWSVYSILLKKIGNRYHQILITRRIFFYGLLTILPLLAGAKAELDFGLLLRPGIFYNILFLGLAASALCFVMWNTAVSLIGVVKTSNYIYLVPLITIVSAAMVLQERITNTMLLGAILILSGVYLGGKGRGRFRVLKLASRESPPKSKDPFPEHSDS
jgi:drug/metabolite transporter (DMT)-like permease